MLLRISSAHAIHWSRTCLVQSLNSPFFPSHRGAEPGRTKEESRITYMRMLRTNHSKPIKITRSRVSKSRVRGKLNFASKPQVAKNVTLMKAIMGTPTKTVYENYCRICSSRKVTSKLAVIVTKCGVKQTRGKN